MEHTIMTYTERIQYEKHKFRKNLIKGVVLALVLIGILLYMFYGMSMYY